MPRFRLVNGREVPFTAAEEIQRDAEEARVAAEMVTEQAARLVEAAEKQRISDLAGKSSLTALEIQEALKLLLRGGE